MNFVSIVSSNINKLIIFMGFLWIREFGLISHVSKFIKFYLRLVLDENFGFLCSLFFFCNSALLFVRF